MTNLGVHIQKYPTGRYGFVGTLPYALGNEVKPSSDDIRGGRAFTNPAGETVTMKFPVFYALRDALTHARNRGVALCDSETCACRSLFE